MIGAYNNSKIKFKHFSLSAIGGISTRFLLIFALDCPTSLFSMIAEVSCSPGKGEQSYLFFYSFYEMMIILVNRGIFLVKMVFM